MILLLAVGFLGGSDGKESAYNAGDLGLIPRLGKSLGKGNGNPLLFSCLENLMDRGACRATVHGVTKSWTRLKRISPAQPPGKSGIQLHKKRRQDSGGI